VKRQGTPPYRKGKGGAHDRDEMEHVRSIWGDSLGSVKYWRHGGGFAPTHRSEEKGLGSVRAARIFQGKLSGEKNGQPSPKDSGVLAGARMGGLSAHEGGHRTIRARPPSTGMEIPPQVLEKKDGIESCNGLKRA